MNKVKQSTPNKNGDDGFASLNPPYLSIRKFPVTVWKYSLTFSGGPKL